MLYPISGRTSRSLAAVSTLFVLVIAGCVAQRESQERRRLADTRKPALHAVHSARLRSVMAELGRQRFVNLPQEMDARRSQQLNFSELGHVAQRMADSAGEIIEAAPASELTPQEREVFVSLAEKLRDEAMALRSAAGSRDEAGAREAMGRITATCNACHSSFRQLASISGL